VIDGIETWKLITWAIGTVGIGGLVALAVFAPAVAKLLLDAVVRFFALVFSYRIGCAVVAAALAWFIADYVRHSIEDDKHAAEIAAFEKAQVARDARIKTETRALVWEEIANATADNAVTDKDVKDFIDALPKPPEGQPAVHPGNPFRVGDDAARLRKIAGQVGRGSVGAQGVPQADTKGASLRDRVRKRLSGGGDGSAGGDQQGQQGDRPAKPVRRSGD
jgi:hypothetical protein